MGRIDNVIVDTPERFSNRNVLNEQHNHSGWEIAYENFDDIRVDLRNCSILETSWDRAQNLEDVFLAMMSVAKPTDECIQQYDEDGSKCSCEEECLLVLREYLGSQVAKLQMLELVIAHSVVITGQTYVS